MMTTKSRVHKRSQMHRHNWYTECWHDCKQKRLRGGLKSWQEIPCEFYIEQYQTTNSTKSFWKNEELQRIITLNIRNIEQIFARNSSRINTIKKNVAESSSRSKQYMPRKFAEMSLKFRFGQEFVEKLGISSNFLDRCLHYFCTILYGTPHKILWRKLGL